MPRAAFNTFGSADTWSNWSKKPTGWAFTNVRGYGNGLDQSQEGGARTSDITLDVLDLGRAVDVSPGFVTGRRDNEGGSGTLSAGTKNVLQVPVFSNGGKAPGTVRVVVRDGGAQGRVVASKTVKLGAFERKYVSFPFTPRAEGPVDLAVTVDPRNAIKEGAEQNQTQVTHLWAGPKNAKVLVVDDDQTLAHERAVQGSLAALGVPYATYTAHPTYAVLKKYDAVIWSTSVDRYEGVLNNADRAAIQKYLDRGGRVLLTGNRAMDALTVKGTVQTPASAVPFGAHYFGVRTPAGNATYVQTQGRVETVRGTGLLKGLKVTTRPSPARQFFSLAGLAGAGAGSAGGTIKPYGKATGLVLAVVAHARGSHQGLRPGLHRCGAGRRQEASRLQDRGARLEHRGRRARGRDRAAAEEGADPLRGEDGQGAAPRRDPRLRQPGARLGVGPLGRHHRGGARCTRGRAPRSTTGGMVGVGSTPWR